MQSETGFPSSHQLKSYVASKSRLKLAARAVLSADTGLLVNALMLVASTAPWSNWFHLFTARRSYASELLRVVILSVRPSVCPSVTRVLCD